MVRTLDEKCYYRLMHYNCTKSLLMYYIKSARLYMFHPILILETVIIVLVECQVCINFLS